MPAKKGRAQQCSKCGKPGHRATTCGRAATPAAGKNSGPPQRTVRARHLGGGASAAIRAAIAKKEGEIAALKSALAVLGG